MTAQTKYITSLLSVFSTYLENLNVSRELALLTTEKFVVFISNREKSDKNWHENWSTNELEKFISTENVPHKSAVLMRKFVSNFTPFEVSIFLHEFLASLQSNNHSNSTIKNYRSDIQQFANIQSQTQIKNFFNPEHLRSFVHQQLQEGLKLSTIKRKLSSISQFALWAEQEGIVSDASFWISDIESLVAGKSIVHESEMGVVRPTQLKTATKELDDYLLSLEIDGHSDATVKNYKSDIGQFLAFSKQANLEQIITQNEIKDFVVSQRKTGLKVSSIKRKITSITQFALWAEERGSLVGVSKWIHSIPTQLFETEKTSPVLNQTNHGVQKKDISTEKFELKLKPTTLIHAHDEKKQQKIWSLPVPEFAQETQTHHQETEKPQSALKGIKASLQDFATQINAKRNKQFLPYLNLAMMLIFAIGLGVLGYQQFIEQAPTPFAYPSTPVRPNRELSFQGRLTDTAQNPITTATNMAFRLYDTGPGAGGTQLWSSGTCSVTPDQDGIFNVGLGDDCGSEITEDVFSENSNVWLEVQIVSETLTPRQSIKTVPYALNSETVQGYPVSATGAATTNTILVMDAGGQVLLGEVSPRLKSTTGTFSIEAQTLSLETSSGSNGNIIINPDGTGKVIVQSDLDLEGYLHAPGATFSATYAGGTALVARSGPSGTANIQEWQNSAGTALNVVDANGNVGIGTTAVTGKLHVTGAATGKALAILNETGDQNIFVASSSGSTKFIMENDGDILTSSVVTIGGANNTAGSLYFFNSGVRLARTGNSGLNIITSGGGATGGTTISGIASGVPLTVIGAASQTANIFEVDNSSGTDLFNVDANGNVGIGSTSPGYDLDLVGEFNLTDAIRVAGDAGTSGYLLTSSGGGANTWTDPATLVSGSTWWANTLNVLHPKNEYATVVDLTIGGNSTASADIQLYSNGAAVFNEQSNAVDFRIESDSNANAFFLQGSSGNIGLGANDPDSLLTLINSGVTSNQLRMRSSRSAIVSGNTLGGIDFMSNDTNLTAPGIVTASITASASATHTASVLTTDIIFNTTSTTNIQEVMRITGGGHVGIGTTTAASRLTVRGTGNTSSTTSLNVTDSDNNSILLVRDNRNVGIGSTSPTARLNVLGFQPAEVGTTPGTAAGLAAHLVGGVGGNTSIATTGVGGAGSGVTLAGGTGGVANAAATASTGGAGGALTFTGGVGGAAAIDGTGSNTGGAGGAFSFTAGTGGAATGNTSGVNTGGIGGAITLTAGTGGAANTGSGNLVGGNGGALTLSGGAGGIGSTSGGTGGTATLQGGAAAAMAGASGGAAAVTGRNGSSTGTGGAGGAVTITAGSAQGDQTVNRAGGAVTITSGASRGASVGGGINLTGAAAGANQTTGTASGAVGGSFTFTLGNGGTAPLAETASTGGAGGTYTITGGAGGAAAVAGTGNNTGGRGSNFTWVAGTGGAATGATSGTNTGGAGGNVGISAGTGGTASNGGVNTAGVGGTLTLNGGLAGDAVSSGGAINFATATTNTLATRMSIRPDGNIGINTTSPTAHLNLRAAASTPGFTITGLAASSVSSGNGANASSILSITGATGQATTDTAAVSGGVGGTMTLTAGTGGAANSSVGGTGGAGGTIGITGGLGATATSGTGGAGGAITLTGGAGGASGAGGIGGNIILVGGAGGGSAAAGNVLLAVTGSTPRGNVGIGTNSPSQSLQITNATLPAIRIDISDTSITAAQELGRIEFQQNDAHSSGIAGSLRYVAETTIAGASTFDTGLILATTLDGSLTDRFFINSAGNVGIGSASPAYTLDVAGELNLTDAIRSAGDAGTSGYLLTSSGGGAMTWTDPSTLAGASLWTNTLNVYHPSNEYASVVDLAIGGNSTASADIQLFANGSAVFNEQSNDSDFRIESDDDANALFVQGSDGNVGIGTNTPAQALSVSGNITGTYLALNGATVGETIGMQTAVLNVSGYSSLGGLRINGADTTNTIWKETGELGVTTATHIRLNTGGSSLVIASNDLQVTGNDIYSGSGTSAITLNGIGFSTQGNVGIGTSSPTGKLHVTGAITGKALTILDETGNQAILVASASGTNRFIIQNDGNVGIGTTTPTGPIHVVADGSLNTTMKFDAGTGRSSGTAAQWDAGYSSGTPIVYRFNVADSGLTSSAQILGVYSSSTPLFYVQSTGKGVFQSSLDNNSGSLSSGLQLNNTFNSAGRYSSLVFGHGTGGTVTSAIQGVSTDISNGYGDLTFFTRSSGGWSEKMRITEEGYVGIGSTNPGYALDVAGEFNLTDAIRVAGDAGTSGYLLTSSGGGAMTWTDPASLTGANYWRLNLGTISPYNDTLDLLVGANSTASAKFAFINVNSGTPTASISGNLAIAVPTGADPATTYNVLNGGSFNLTTSPGGNAGATSRLFIANNGNIGINTTNPTAKVFLKQSADTTGTDGIYIERSSVTSHNGSLYVDSSTGSLNVGGGIRLRLFDSSNMILDSDGGGSAVPSLPRGVLISASGVQEPAIQISADTTERTYLRYLTAANNVSGRFKMVTTNNPRLKYESYLTLESTPTNYERLAIYPDSSNNIFRIEAENGGTGTLRNLTLQGGGGNVGIGSLAPAYTLDVVGELNLTDAIRSAGDAGTSGYLLTSSGGGAMTWTDPASLTGANYWRLNLGTISPYNDTLDLLVGANSTASAKFAFMNVNSGTPTASISGNLAIAVPTGADPATTYNVLNGGSFNLTTSPGGNAGATSRLFIANNGNVGIGSTSPGALLDISKGSSSASTGTTVQQISFTDNAGSTSVGGITNNALNIAHAVSGTVGVGRLQTINGANIAITNSSTIVGEQYISGLQINNNFSGDDSGASQVDLYGIKVTTNGDVEPGVSTHYGGYFLTSGTAAANIGLRLNTFGANTNWGIYSTGEDQNYFSGNVGIGTSGPVGKLNVSGAITGKALTILDETGNQAIFVASASGTNRFIIQNDGNVGIGSTSPAYKIDVNGTGRFSGAVDLDADLELNSTLTDINGSVGTSGQILSSTATGVDWIDVSSIGYNSWTIADDDTDTYSIVDGNILRFTSSDSNILTNLTNGDDGDENMDFSIRLLGDAVAGDGLTGGADNVLVGADIDVTFTVNAGDGIALVTDTVTVDEAYAFAWTGAQSWSTTADFNGDVSIADTNIALDGASTTLTSTGAFTLTPGGAVILGDGGDTMVINTSDWDISAVGAMTGITGISNDGSYTQTGTSANTFTGTATFSNATYSALFTGGNVGIGSATPAYQLDLVGEFNLTDAIRVAGDAGTSGYLLTSSGGGANTWTDPATLVSGSTWWANTLNVLHPKNEYASVVDLAIGGTATASADIQLFANGAAVFNEQSNSVDFRVESNGDTHALFVQGSANNIGIGTSAPVQKLQVSSNQDTTIRIETLDTSIITDQLLGKIEFQQNDANSSGVAGSMRYEAEAGIGGAGSFDTRFVIATTVDSTLTDRFYINSDGNVGIGESTPDAKLQVAGDIFPTTDDTYDLGSSSLRWQDLYLGPASLHIGTNGNEGIIGYNTTGNYLSFDPDGDADADVSIVDAGYLGIGTTAPIHALEVNRAVTGKALVLLKETGDQNILTASNSAGVTRFVMANTGYMHAERFADMSNSAYFLDPAASGTSMAVVENVGIGTTTPGARLDVRNSSTEDILNLFDGATEVLTVLDGGNVGIGTTTPGYIADIVGRSRIRGASSNGGGFWLTTSAAPTTDITYFGRGSDAEAWAGIYNNGAWRVYIPDASGNVGIGTSIPAQSLDTGGDLRVGGNDITDSGNTTRITLGASTYVTSTTFNLTGTTNFNATSLTAMDTAATMSWSGVTALTFAADNATIYGSDVADGDITIHGTSNATRTTSYVNLQPTAGNVGIGTTAPASKLHIYGGTRASSPLTEGIHMGLDGSSNYGIEIANNGGIPLIDFTNDLEGTDFDARIGLYGDDILALMGANVGIGTTAPAAQLSFEGTAGKTIQVDPNTNAAAGGALIVSSGDSGSGTNLAGGEMRVRSGSSTGNNNSFISFYTPAAGNTGTAVRTPIERARITSTGIGIGTTTLVRALTVAGSARITTSVAVTDTLTLCTDANGDIEFKSGACTVSSIKYKQNVQNLSYGLDAINEMNPVFFEYKDIVGNDLSGRTKRKVGFIAEEMQLVIPEVIIYQDGEIDGIDYAFLTSVLAKGIQELDAKVESIFTNLVASTAHITDLTVESLKIGGQTIEEYIASVVSSQNNSNSNELLSPIEGELTVDSLITNSVTASGSSTLGSLLVSDDLNTNTLTVSGDATVSGSLLAGLIGSDILVTNTATTSNLLVTKDATIAGTLIANHIDTTSSRIAALEAGIAQLETVRATTAELVTATVSGTLYADNIYNFENKVASTLQQPGLLDVLLGNNESTASASYLQDLYNTVNKTEFNASESADLDLTLAELNLTSDDVALTGSALFVEKYFKVNGAGFISDSLAIGNKLFVGETMQIADGLVRYTTADPTNQILKIQPEGQGSIELLAGIVTIDDSGKVTVNGDLEVTGNAKIAGTLLTNMLKPGDFGNPLQVQVAGVDTASGEIKKSRFEIINEVGIPVATFSAEGNAEFAGSVNISGGIGIANQDLGSNENNELSADKTSGKATIKSGASEVIIKSALIKNESLVYVTAVGSTGNQVLYVKSQATDDPNTPDQEGRFVVGFDNATTTDVSFNWWIVN